MPAGTKEITVSRVALVAVLLLGLPVGGCNSRPQPARAEASAPSAEAAPSTNHLLRVRTPAVAGLFYPAEAPALARMVDGLLASAPPHYVPHLKALICPHAGYPYSGPTAAIAYKTLAGRGIQTVVILGPSHYARFVGASVPDVDAYRTPLGTVPLSAKAQQLVKTGPFVLEAKGLVERPTWARQSSRPVPAAGEDTPDTWEHSIEVQVPFLQRVLKDFSILPAVLGDVDPESAARALAGVLDDKTVIVASSDLSHYHPYDEAKDLDNHCIGAILELKSDLMKTQEACGKLPIMTLINLARLKGWKAQLLDYRNSGDTAGDKSGVVGYTAIAFYEPASEHYAAPERRCLLDLARRTLSCVTTNPSLSGFEVNARDLPPKLAETKACFVTLRENGELRGCIGHILPQEPLYQAVVDNARNAATRDSRFLPVQPGEAGKIKIEISVLTEPQPLNFSSPEDLLNKLKPNEDGVLLQIGSRGATFLPQVWEQLPDKAEFLNHLAQKAGCAPNDWRGRNVNVSTYHVEAFEESE
jgi:MEMO1 family protein